MRPYDGYYEDSDDLDELVYDRSQALHRLLDDFRREERHHNRHRSSRKVRHNREPWDWSDDDDWDSYLDDSGTEFYKETQSHF